MHQKYPEVFQLELFLGIATNGDSGPRSTIVRIWGMMGPRECRNWLSNFGHSGDQGTGALPLSFFGVLCNVQARIQASDFLLRWSYDKRIALSLSRLVI